MKLVLIIFIVTLTLCFGQRPNVVIIVADDLVRRLKQKYRKFLLEFGFIVCFLLMARVGMMLAFTDPIRYPLPI